MRLLTATGIYSITNKINGKFYIGSASGKGGFSDRWYTHRYDFSKNKNSKHLQCAWNKYGKDNFEFKILLICEPYECIKYEQMLLNYLKPWDPSVGYNICKDAKSSLGIPRSLEAKIKHKLTLKEAPVWNKGIPRDAETRKKISDNHKGKALSADHKKSISRSLRSSSLKYKRKVDRIDPVTGECKEYDSIKSAGQDGFQTSCIHRVLQGKSKTTGGYFWYSS